MSETGVKGRGVQEKDRKGHLNLKWLYKITQRQITWTESVFESKLHFKFV